MTTAPMARIVLPLTVLGAYAAALVIQPVRPVAASAPIATTVDIQAATALVRAGNYADALPPLLKLTESFPRNHELWKDLALVYQHLDRPIDQAAALERFVLQSPAPWEACPAIGDAYRRAGQMPKAIDAFDRCFTFQPDDVDMMFGAARAAEWSGRLDRAEELYRKALAVSDRNLDVVIGLARLELHRDRLDAALSGAEAVLAIDPKAVDALLVAALASQRQGHRDAARKYFERGLAVQEAYPDLHLGLGIVEEEDGRTAEALRHYQRAQALDPAREDIRTRLNRLSGGKQ